MSYFLYKKADIRNFEEFRKAQYKSTFSAIRIAVVNDKKLSYTFKHFMKKYFTILEYGEAMNSKEKTDAFKAFLKKHQLPSGENTFGVIGSDGTVFEPLDFIKFLDEHNYAVDQNKTQVKRKLSPIQIRKL
mgnify:FL=1